MIFVLWHRALTFKYIHLRKVCLIVLVKTLYDDNSQDGDEEALFKDVALGFLFLGAGKVLEKGFRTWKAGRATDDVVKQLDELADPPRTFRDPKGRLRNKDGTFAKDPKTVKFNRSMAERKKALTRDALDPDNGLSDRARKQILDSNGKKVSKGYEVDHTKPLYTKKTIEGKKSFGQSR